MYRPPLLFSVVKNGFQGVPERYKWVPHAMLANRRSRAGYPLRGGALLTGVRLRLAMYRGYGYGWEFLFLGANIDAIETARHIGIDADHAADYCCDSAGTAVNYECLSKAVTAFRCAAPIGAAWKKDIEEDYKRRKK